MLYYVGFKDVSELVAKGAETAFPQQFHNLPLAEVGFLAVGGVIDLPQILAEVDHFKGQVAQQAVHQLLVVVVGKGQVYLEQDGADQQQGWGGFEQILNDIFGQSLVLLP